MPDPDPDAVPKKTDRNREEPEPLTADDDAILQEVWGSIDDPTDEAG